MLLADEPVAALDPRHQLSVLDVLRARARQGCAVVAVMHDLALASRYADRLVIMQAGRIAAEGAPAQVLDARRLAEVFGIEAAFAERDGERLIALWRVV